MGMGGGVPGIDIFSKSSNLSFISILSRVSSSSSDSEESICRQETVEKLVDLDKIILEDLISNTRS